MRRHAAAVKALAWSVAPALPQPIQLVGSWRLSQSSAYSVFLSFTLSIYPRTPEAPDRPEATCSTASVAMLSRTRCSLTRTGALYPSCRIRGFDRQASVGNPIICNLTCVDKIQHRARLRRKAVFPEFPPARMTRTKAQHLFPPTLMVGQLSCPEAKRGITLGHSSDYYVTGLHAFSQLLAHKIRRQAAPVGALPVSGSGS